MLNTYLSCVHFEDALVQLEPNSVLDVNWGVELDMQLSVNFRMEVDWELFDIIVIAPLTHSRTHAHTWHPLRDWEPTHYHPVSLGRSLSRSISHPLTHPLPHALPHSVTHSLTQSVSPNTY